METDIREAERPSGARLTGPDIDRTELKYSGKVLADIEIVDLVMNGDFNNLDVVVEWLGSNIPAWQRPVSRFPDVIAKNFDNLKKEQKEKFLLNGMRIALGDFRKSLNVPVCYSTYKDKAINWAFVLDGAPLVDAKKMENVGELLSHMLKYTDNDLQEARRVLAKTDLTIHDRVDVRMFAYNFYRQGTNPSSEDYRDKLREEYRARNPKIRLLGFWLGIDVGKLGPRSPSFDELLEKIYPNSDIEIRTQIMTFIKESLFVRKVPEMKYFMIERILTKTPTDASDANDLNFQLVNEANIVKTVLQMDRLLKKTKGGKISVEDLINLLEKHLPLLGYVTEKELEMALDKTKDHGLAARLIRLKRAKERQDIQQGLASQSKALQAT